MRVGFVRNVGLAMLGLAVAVTAACNDDPLSDVDKDAVFDIQANPTAMTVTAGTPTLLQSRAVNEVGEPTYSAVDFVVSPACVTVEPDTITDTVLFPPGRFWVTGGSTVGGCTITLSSGGVTKDVTVNNVAGAIIVVEAPDTINFGQTVTLDARLVTTTDPPAEMGPFDNTDATWSSSNPGVASVDAAGNVTGIAAGSATITACWSGTEGTGTAGLGYETCTDVAIEVIVAAPTVTGLSVSSGPAFGTVTVQGSGFVSAHQLYIGGTFPDNDQSLFITNVTDTEFTFLWPALDPDGAYEVYVGVPPDAIDGPVTFTQTEGISAEPNEPANDSETTTPIAIAGGGSYIGGFGGGDTGDYIRVDIAADGSFAPVVDWNSGQDLDLYLLDSGLSEICHSWYSQPEDECGTVELTAGTYWIYLEDYSGGVFNSTYRFDMYDMTP